MKTAFKKKMSMLLVMVLIVSMFAGFTLNASAEGDTTYLAFTSDMHFDKAKTNPFEAWMNNLQNVVKSLDYMGFCGDMGSAYAATTTLAYWEHVQAAMDLANSYVTSGYIANKNIFVYGNHEYYTAGGGDFATNKDNATALLYTPNGEAVKTDNYILYAFGAESTPGEHYGAAQGFSAAAIAALKTYLEAAPKDIPIVIMSHFPIHTWNTRVSKNSTDLVNVLNAHTNVIFLWGHNHTNSDTYYDNIYNPGDTIEVESAKTKVQINFTYAAAGCMSDAEYGTGGAFVKGKGLVMGINGTSVSMTYYGLEGNALDGAETIDITKSVDITAPPVTPPPAGTYTVKLSNQAVTVDGVAKNLEVYNIDGSNYFKLRDLAFVLNGTGSQFSVGYDEAKKMITCTTGTAYTPDGTELKIGADKSATAAPSAQSLYIDGKASSITAFNIGGNNFFKLRDAGTALKFNVNYDDATRTMLITSNKADTATPAADKGDPVGKVYVYAVLDADICKDTKGTQIVYYPVPIYKDDTIADAITTLHEVAYGDGKAWASDSDATYGNYLTKFWGKEVGDLTYGGGGIWTSADLTVGKHANLKAAVTDGTILYLNMHTGGTFMRTGFFDKQYVELKAGDSLELTFSRCSGDGAIKPCTSSDVQIDGAAAGTTDSSAKITLKFDKAGNYVVTGVGKQSYGTAVCYVVVK
jgi:predicted phosphodiesterase